MGSQIGGGQYTLPLIGIPQQRQLGSGHFMTGIAKRRTVTVRR